MPKVWAGALLLMESLICHSTVSAVDQACSLGWEAKLPQVHLRGREDQEVVDKSEYVEQW